MPRRAAVFTRMFRSSTAPHGAPKKGWCAKPFGIEIRAGGVVQRASSVGRCDTTWKQGGGDIALSVLQGEDPFPG